MFANSMPVRITFSLLLLLNSLARTLAVPAPTNTYDKVERGDYKDNSRTWVGSDYDHGSCSVYSELPLCSSYGICLSPPRKHSKLVAVVLGVGTQNYTCTSPTQVPTGNGAMATLYDITKSVGLTPDAAHAFSAIVMALSTAQNTQNIPLGLGYPKIGEHHFEPRSGKGAVAVFNLWVKGKQLKFVGGKLEGIPPPPDSFPGSVDWLKLGRTAGIEKESRGIKFVYRVHTAGGKAPATCEGLRHQHTVNYATEYCE
ncbi:hypothetical protein L211DRAFT_836859 [Terfezia boudieri ATCC MYA-4762]|uniref:Malate dehydrogenase n=1 Tax=Terfezia boudieri ATCC MYA-4762 TaxID=1051890 RepID=A0A3N4LWH5_9PEZI|nr:hypothetical protein L211DRAFT_836859 [Terfezia boudieri ATCC MYA-4762]